MNLLTLRFPLDKDMLTTVRLATGGVCSLLGFSLDESEDCKVCVTESLLLLLHRGFRSAEVRFSRENRLSVSIAGEEGGEPSPSGEEDISIALLSALVDDAEIDLKDGNISFCFGAL